ncbi:hypothetical protein O7602_25195 [Micromonospora sp. WMMD1128]|uniref:hypothetical protein n=1 Tax=unclassified Micromonospora TaxID=2617518 RepID=UPI00248B2E7F|nr:MULTISPECIES: hypothetical protein [unclassified Micromonospora]WBB72954.1 hypothetical protein O7602_25195 [Micromonospora sp. WMMD1128]WFE33598.1 hypothetical protein O7613_29465 [Micromonospora sp. WMMD975]
MSGTRPAGDNRTGNPERPLAVGEDELERALRETLSRRVVTTRPLRADPAGDVLRRARRAGRRRALTGLALAGVATVLVTTGMAQLGGSGGRGDTSTVVLGDPHGSSASPLPTAATPMSGPGPVRAELDLLVGDVLDTSGGERRELTGVGNVERAQRVHDREGWLLTSAATAAGRTLWWVPAGGGAPQVMLAAADAVAVSPDGRQVAWRDGSDLVAAGVVAGQLIAPSRVAAPPGVVPIGFTGDDVLVARPGRGGTSVWQRAMGGVPGAANPDVRAVYGMRPDGRVVGLVTDGSAGKTCLALLDPARDLAPTRTDCGPKLAADGLGAVSPDGRWLLANGAARTALLVDLAATSTAHPAGPALAGAVAWTRAGTALHVDAAGGLVRVEPGRVLAGQRPTASALDGVPPGQRPVVVADTPATPDGA